MEPFEVAFWTLSGHRAHRLEGCSEGLGTELLGAGEIVVLVWFGVSVSGIL